MAEINYEELKDLEITLDTEEAGEIELELSTIFEYEGTDYAAFLQKGNPENEVFFFGMEVTEEREDEADIDFNYIMDEEMCDELLQIFQQIMDAQAEENEDESEADGEADFDPMDIEEDFTGGSWVVRL